VPWWWWFVGGAALLLLELVTPVMFVFIFMGVAAMLVGTAAWAWPDLPLWVGLAAFSVLSVVLLGALRGPVLRRLHASPDAPRQVDTMIGEAAFPKTDLAPGQTGQCELRGTLWNARNESEVVLPAGSRCRVVRVDGITLGITQ
jgi:hypothetical protein